jgi:hypothetical protein
MAQASARRKPQAVLCRCNPFMEFALSAKNCLILAFSANLCRSDNGAIELEYFCLSAILCCFWRPLIAVSHKYTQRGREDSGRRAGGEREARSKCAKPILFLQQGRARRTKSGHAEKRNRAGVSPLTSCGTNPCPGGWYSSIFQVSLALLPLERSGACYCL